MNLKNICIHRTLHKLVIILQILETKQLNLPSRLTLDFMLMSYLKGKALTLSLIITLKHNIYSIFINISVLSMFLPPNL